MPRGMEPRVTDGALRAVHAWTQDVLLRPINQRGPWMARILVVLTPGALAGLCEELLAHRAKEARRGEDEGPAC